MVLVLKALPAKAAFQLILSIFLDIWNEVQRVMNAMMKKVKPDVTALETAYDDV